MTTAEDKHKFELQIVGIVVRRPPACPTPQAASHELAADAVPRAGGPEGEARDEHLDLRNAKSVRDRRTCEAFALDFTNGGQTAHRERPAKVVEFTLENWGREPDLPFACGHQRSRAVRFEYLMELQSGPDVGLNGEMEGWYAELTRAAQACFPSGPRYKSLMEDVECVVVFPKVFVSDGGLLEVELGPRGDDEDEQETSTRTTISAFDALQDDLLARYPEGTTHLVVSDANDSVKLYK